LSGGFVILREEDLSVLFEGKDSKSPVSCVGYSPAGDTLAVAVEEGSIYLYAVQDDYEFVGQCIGHRAGVFNIDFSIDGDWMRSNSSDRTIMFWSTDDASIQTNIQSMRDVEWIKLNCPYTWHTKSIHYSTFPGESATSVDVPTPIHDANYLICGTSYGYVRLQNYPTPEDSVSACHKYPAHVNAVGNIKFSFDGLNVLSIGSYDRCVIQWKAESYLKDSPGKLLEDDISIEEEKVAKTDKKEKKIKKKAPDTTLVDNKDLLIESKAGEELIKEFMIDNNTSLTAARMNTEPNCPPADTVP
jgi:WD40 repeat protein